MTPLPGTAAAGTVAPSVLRRRLGTWGAVGLSLALMAPANAMNINPQGTANVVGPAVPVCFALAAVGALLVAWSFVRLTRRYHHAGSVYGYVGATLGPRAGIASGWLLVMAYSCFALCTAVAAGRFLSALLGELPDAEVYVVALVVLAVITWLSSRAVQRGSRFFLGAEVATVVLIALVCVVVLVRLVNGTAPGGLGVDIAPLLLPSGVDSSALFLGVVFGFLSFAGFEAAATLGEETREPGRAVPRAILATVAFGGAFFVAVTAIEVMGFGTSSDGIARFVASQSLVGDLGTAYVAPWVGGLVTLGASVSALSCAAASLLAASRLVFAMARDGAGPRSLSTLSTSAVPARAVTTVAVVLAVVTGLSAVLVGASTFDLFVAAGTAGTLVLLVVYAATTIGAVRLVLVLEPGTVPRRELVVPVAAVLVLGYTLLRSVWPLPSGATLAGAAAAAAAVVGVTVLAAVRPRAARRAR